MDLQASQTAEPSLNPEVLSAIESIDSLPHLIRPMQTWYADCKFRSRLEARWAVFFDALGLDWSYEPETYMVGGKPYLPDFWLPGLNRWAEVKGVLSQHDLDRLVAAADPVSGLPADPSGEPFNPRNPSGTAGRLLLLGEIPRGQVNACIHVRIDYCHDQVVIRDFVFDANEASDLYDWAISDGLRLNREGSIPDASHWGPFWLGQTTHKRIRVATKVKNAYRAARSARFEHGESGAVETTDGPIELVGALRPVQDDGPQEILHGSPLRPNPLPTPTRKRPARKAAKRYADQASQPVRDEAPATAWVGEDIPRPTIR